MKLRLLLGLVGLLLLGAAGFGVYQFATYQGSIDKVADDFVADLIADNSDTAYNRLSDRLKTASKEYWQQQDAFRILRGYQGQTQKTGKERVRSADPQLPDPYSPQTEAWRVTYRFAFAEAPFELQLVIIKRDGSNQWVINEIDSTFVAS